jgi:anti-sigma factor RsiW
VSTQLSCRELVELVTEYLDGSMAPVTRARFEAHLERCFGCTTYLEQMRETVQLAGRLREGDVPDALRDAFRGWR